jgi:hypothetical protein
MGITLYSLVLIESKYNLPSFVLIESTSSRQFRGEKCRSLDYATNLCSDRTGRHILGRRSS